MRVLYLDLDSLRSDHLGCYGYQRNTSPNIDRIAQSGVHFTQCYSSDMPCMPSRTALFSGQFGIRNGCVAHTGSRGEPYSEGETRQFRNAWAKDAWMTQLRQLGMKTVTFSSFAERHSAWHWYAGFQEIHDTGHVGHEIADDVTPHVLQWLSEHGEEDNWFMHVNYWDIHVPYRTPVEYGNIFADEPMPDSWLSEEVLARHSTEPGIRSALDNLFVKFAEKRPDLNPVSMLTTADVKLMVDAYDTAIRYVDEHIGILMKMLGSLGVLEETVVIVSADHGECLGELNAYGGHCFADECTAHVPWVMRWPGKTTGKAGQAVEQFCYQLDIAATVTDGLGADVPEVWNSTSMQSQLSDSAEAVIDRDKLCLSQMAQTVQRSVRFDIEGKQWIYIRTYRKGYYPFEDEMLFNLSDDPHETRDLSGKRGDIVDFARKTLEEWCKEQLGRSKHPDPLDEVLTEVPEVKSSEYAERLRSTGRGEWVNRLGLE